MQNYKRVILLFLAAQFTQMIWLLTCFLHSYYTIYGDVMVYSTWHIQSQHAKVCTRIPHICVQSSKVCTILGPQKFGGKSYFPARTSIAQDTKKKTVTATFPSKPHDPTNNHHHMIIAKDTECPNL